MAETIWTFERGEGPVVATAIHDGHAVRPEALQLMVISESARLREEDPYTGSWTTVAPTRVVALRSRFEIDLNRPRDEAVYRTPDDAWGLEVWREPPPAEVISHSLENYDAFYREMRSLFSTLEARHGKFLVLDLHSYNHRRDGPAGPPADPALNPQVNIGTGRMPDRGRWAPLIDRFSDRLATFDFPGGALDVRENVKFEGGAFAVWTNQRFPQSACLLSIEVKKFFMNEWTGVADPVLLAAIGAALQWAVDAAVEELHRR